MTVRIRAGSWRVCVSIALLACGVVLTLPSLARAELIVRTLEQGAWPASVASLQTSLQSEGSVVHVVVSDETGRRAWCGDYTLAFDEVGVAAFGVGACDPATHATALVLRNRSALFAHGDVIAHPLPVAITAVETRRASVSGGAASVGGSDVNCTVAVRPFLRDMETGNVVHLVPGRFVLRPLGAGVTAAALTDGWTLTGAHVALSIDYEVFDTRRNEVVLRDRATLSCGDSAIATVAAPAPDPMCPDAIPLVPGTTVNGSTMNATNRFAALCGAGGPAPDQLYSLVLTEATLVRLRLSSAYDGVLTIRTGCGGDAREIACNDDNPDTRHSALDRVLGAGVYYVVVDGYSATSRGEYSLAVGVSAPDAPPSVVEPAVVETLSTCSNAAPLPHDVTVHGTTEHFANQVSATCGNAQSPERVYALTLDHRSRVRLRLASDYDGVLYVRTGCGAGTELGCNDDNPDTRHSALDLTLEQGTYYVFVDGYGTGRGGQYDLTAQVEPLRLGLDVRAAMTYASSGSSLGFGLGAGATADLRVPIGSIFLIAGFHYGQEWFSGAIGTPVTQVDLHVTTLGVPVALDVPFGDSGLSVYSVVEPTALISNYSLAATSVSGRSSSGTDTSIGFNVGSGVEYRPWRSFGLYTEFDYRLASVTVPGLDPLLSSGFGYTLGLAIGF